MRFQASRKTGDGRPVQWLMQDRVMMGDVNLIDGRKQSGKSALVSKLIGKWATEGPENGNTKLRNILWLHQEEDFDAVIKPRLIQYGVDPDSVITLDYKRGNTPRPVLPLDLEELTEFCRQHDVNCIVIDPFTELKPHDWTPNDGDQMRQYLGSLSALCSRLGATMFAMRHMRKSTGPYTADDGAGSVQISAAVRVVLRVDFTEEKPARRFFSVQSCNLAPQTHPIEFAIDFLKAPYGQVRFLGEKDITISEIRKLSEAKVEQGKREEAQALLMEACGDGEQPANLLIEEAKEAGIGERTLVTAKSDLNMLARRRVNPSTGKAYWVWLFPQHAKDGDIPKEATTKLEPGPDMQTTILDLPEMNTWTPAPYNPAEPEPITEPTPTPPSGQPDSPSPNATGTDSAPTNKPKKTATRGAKKDAKKPAAKKPEPKKKPGKGKGGER